VNSYNQNSKFVDTAAATPKADHRLTAAKMNKSSSRSPSSRKSSSAAPGPAGSIIIIINFFLDLSELSISYLETNAFSWDFDVFEYAVSSCNFLSLFFPVCLFRRRQ
jgi:hypothetical protein